MGAWGTGIFDNDDAMDWLDELRNSEGADLLADAFAAAGAEALGAPEGCRILCAAAALAVASGRAVPGAPDMLKIWAAGLFEDDINALLPAARSAVARVLAAESELKELWQENAGDYPQWEREAKVLMANLQ